MSSICKVSFFHIRNISRIRKYMSVENTRILVQAFVTCRLDHGNALLYADVLNISLQNFKLF